MRKIITIVIITLFSCMIIFSCKKKKDFSTSSSHHLNFSADTITFDTVFTGLGSTTARLMLYNKNGENLKISSIKLGNGSSSMFNININGQPGHQFSDIEILDGDSLYVFVKVTIDPNDKNNPFLVEDKLLFNTNGNEQVVHLTAYGQNANYIVADQTVGSFPKFKKVADSLQETHWTAERPYVIYGYALIDSYGTLVIEPGTHIYIHNGGGIWAYSQGQLRIEGSADEPVVIQGDRLEQFYSDKPGQWDRIWLMEARAGEGHSIENAIIRNGYIGIQTERFLRNNEAQMSIHNTIIDNMSGMGVYSNCYTLDMSNMLIRHCGAYGLALVGGGSYRASHLTIANHWSETARTTPSVFMDNLYLNPTEGVYYPIDFKFNMNNSIVYGSNVDEILTEFYKEAPRDTSYNFSNCLIRSKRRNDGINFTDCCFNENPNFVDYSKGDLHLDSISPARGLANPAFLNEKTLFDLEGNIRVDSISAGALN